MRFRTFGDKTNPSLMLLPGLGVSYELYLPLIERLKDRFHLTIRAKWPNGFLI